MINISVARPPVRVKQGSLIASLFVVLAVLAAVFVCVWIGTVRKHGRAEDNSAELDHGWPGSFHLLIGFATNFLDTLGIGSFATTTSLFRLRRLVPDELIPGTLNAGHALPAVTEAFIYMAIIKVDPATLALLIGAAVVGAFFGAGVLTALPRRRIQLGMGLALLVAAGLMLLTQLSLLPAGGDTLGLSGARLVFGIAGNLILGALMTIGVGLYAPCMLLVSFLGMNPRGAFPVMMGACAFLMPVAGIRFIRKKRYSPKSALGLTLAGIPGVFLAAYIVRSLPLGAVRWLVILIVIYTSSTMLRSAAAESERGRAESMTSS